MRSLDICAKITVCDYDELTEVEKKLIDVAKKSSQSAYAPYSGFCVGAAVLLSNGEIVTGSNQENAAYPSGLCAERVAIFAAGAIAPNEAITAIAIAGWKKGLFLTSPLPPCGACRQVMIESEKRLGKKMKLYLYGTKEIYRIESAGILLPLTFDNSTLNE